MQCGHGVAPRKATASRPMKCRSFLIAYLFVSFNQRKSHILWLKSLRSRWKLWKHARNVPEPTGGGLKTLWGPARPGDVPTETGRFTGSI